MRYGEVVCLKDYCIFQACSVGVRILDVLVLLAIATDAWGGGASEEGVKRTTNIR
jgi:hypothetical protein